MNDLYPSFLDPHWMRLRGLGQGGGTAGTVRVLARVPFKGDVVGLEDATYCLFIDMYIYIYIIIITTIIFVFVYICIYIHIYIITYNNIQYTYVCVYVDLDKPDILWN